MRGVRRSDRKDTAAGRLDTLIETIAAQSEHVDAEDPARKFVATLMAGLRSGAFHVNSAANAEHPPSPLTAWGWRRRESHQKRDDGTSGTTYEEQPGGPLIGYVDDDAGELWLLPAAATQALRRFDATATPHTERTVGRHLDTAGVLMREPSQENLKTRRSVDGQRAYYWVLRLDRLGDDDAVS